MESIITQFFWNDLLHELFLIHVLIGRVTAVRQRLVEDKEGECGVLTRRVAELEAEAALHDAEVCAALSYYCSRLYAALSSYLRVYAALSY
jgi:hypothetical protein